MNIVTKLQIKAFIEASGIPASLIGYSDYKTAREHNAKHLRKGKINNGEGKGVAVHAMYWDTLGNTVALCADGIVRQYY